MSVNSVLSAVNESIQTLLTIKNTSTMNKKTIKAAAAILGYTEERLSALLETEMNLSVCQNERRQIADMHKSLLSDYEKLQDVNEHNKMLIDSCRAFSFILPEPHSEAEDCVTDTELYRVQYNLAKKQWKETLNKTNKTYG